MTQFTHLTDQTDMSQYPKSLKTRRQHGIVLPMAMILLVILSFAGLLAAKNAATHEQFSNNIRTTQVANQAAEAGLRFCERVAIDSFDDEADTVVSSAADMLKVYTTELTSPEDATAEWRTKSNWLAGAGNLISSYTTYSSNVDANAELINAPTCIIQKLVNDSFVVTSRGLSNDAELDASGVLSGGSEVWMQSIITPGYTAVFN